MTKRLKPCPFCGQPVYIQKNPLWTESYGSTRGYYNCYEYVIQCNNPDCRCTVSLPRNDTIYNSDEEAINNAVAAWNRRAENNEESKLRPKRPLNISNENVVGEDIASFGVCPSCGFEISSCMKYCLNCGQKLKWK